MIHGSEHILISPSKLGPNKRSDNAKMSPVHKGEVLEGRIIKSIPPDHVLLLIKGKQVVARTRVLLKPGNLAFFKVEQVAPQCILKLVELQHGQQDGLGELLKGSALRGFPYKLLIDILDPLIASLKESDPRKLPDILTRMWALLGHLSLHEDDVCHPGFLKSFIDTSGMIWEQKLKSLLLSGLLSRSQAAALMEQDLKGLALSSLADASAVKLLSTDGVTRFLDALEQFQLLNLLGLEEKGKLLLIIPMQWDEGFNYAQLLIDLGDKQGDGTGRNEKDRVLRLSLFLDMSRLGPVRVDASIFQKVIRIGFLVCNEKSKALLSHNAYNLKEHLERHGFFVQHVTYRLEEQSSLADTSLVEAIIDPEEHYISLVI